MSDSDTKTPRLRNREEGRKFSYITRSISALKQQIEFNRRCIGVFTTSLPFSSRDLTKFGIDEDDVVCTGSPTASGYPQINAAFMNYLSAEMKLKHMKHYKSMSQDHQC